MKERPILFSALMVRAILSGAKSQTRRVMKPQPVKAGSFWEWAGAGWSMDLGPIYPVPGHTLSVRCPYGQPGDLLWVRESWRIGAWCVEEGSLCIDYRDGPRKEWIEIEDGDEFEKYWIQCSEELEHKGIEPDADGRYTWEPGSSPLRWRPSIHMPRWASRITLRITSVRVERLHTIGEKDAIAEGIEYDAGGDDWPNQPHEGGFRNYLSKYDACDLLPNASFRSLWRSINGDDSWDANPWVWVIEFERVESGS